MSEVGRMLVWDLSSFDCTRTSFVSFLLVDGFALPQSRLPHSGLGVQGLQQLLFHARLVRVGFVDRLDDCHQALLFSLLRQVLVDSHRPALLDLLRIEQVARDRPQLAELVERDCCSVELPQTPLLARS